MNFVVLLKLTPLTVIYSENKFHFKLRFILLIHTTSVFVREQATNSKPPLCFSQTPFAFIPHMN